MPQKTNINEIARQLDNKYKNIFITGNDTTSLNQIDFKEAIVFSKLEEKLNKEYGLGFKKTIKEIRFIEIK